MDTSRVLLVDDEIEYMETLKKRLTKRDLAVATAGRGEDALSRIKELFRAQILALRSDLELPF